MHLRLEHCPAPAKLNLFLHVTGRRADGYHLLQTAFQLLDHGDTLDFAVRDDGAIIRSNDIAGVPADSDLIVRAARLLQQASGCRLGADLTLHKVLPMGGGLGGGSSDAATTLIALNHLWATGLSRTQLMDLGLQLGADVPFFLFGENAFAEGVGEQLQAITTPECWFVVIEPGVQIPTPAIFSSKELTRDTKPVRITDFSSTAEMHWKNDLQTIACAMFPVVDEAIQWLSQFGNAKMTGSGACVFCAFFEQSKADEVIAKMPQRWTAWKAKSLSRHPMADLVK
ncbi:MULTISPECIES: 4-(cytidine 5'-diphospho)-2-C-methyl-D-erythritol kinase [unclassified Undibacterium]|uniref:4-(cytidine 5'-diphospho)-2-C-methyl-D-erythritol kinase n=1 Tax=unclassified Undibacterium TaxID=2630295 RepID=UPI002AC8DA33|nr:MULTISPECIES: 4-(cytidine 5'-diphospho)-2-C-methyl-D-erythritol kinase [unclassified Undibacterium]MEB0140337.1 4-(cytidine 5'-diphospho)-2-C-methyl-D-erythritol kinase [Undibacterium sp. CCC2.1]MEB0172340.1 4-(cytidine 5'-diphospho)-2-C-methyl-D-erythritol kinase [Undibacterium sp. CCC1.1]MEB0176256.1 4-(cytidine 5'-diphospho)-2-C-methyl-D-erythritol kinase [Undibacterium sp. CCC3.4]MEB0215504.1 4-(cytidine 5'-diphospho)-2-C-methyl-D-erythritol kinase [Undibacterium sp. 5I2]WPX44350.1 4-(c